MRSFVNMFGNVMILAFGFVSILQFVIVNPVNSDKFRQRDQFAHTARTLVTLETLCYVTASHQKQMAC